MLPRQAFFFALCAACTTPLDPSAPAWNRLESAGPSARWGHAAVYDDARHRMLVFGGQSADGELADLWSLDLDRETWTKLSPSGPAPAARVNPSAVVDPSRDRHDPRGRANGPRDDVRRRLGARSPNAPVVGAPEGSGRETARALRVGRHARVVLRRRRLHERVRRSLAARFRDVDVDRAPERRRRALVTHVRRDGVHRRRRSS